MRRILRAAATGSALVLGGALAAAPAALADPSPAPDPVVGAAVIGISPHETVHGRTVSISGACAPYPGASVTSVSSPAGTVGLTDVRPQHIRGTLRVTAGQGAYPVSLVCSNGGARTQLRVDAPPPRPGPRPAPAPRPPAPPAHHGRAPDRGLVPVHRPAGHAGQAGRAVAADPAHPAAVPQGAPRSGAPAANGDSRDTGLFLGGVAVAVVAGVIVMTVRRPSRRGGVR
ncbi:hypothetical protein [Streptomyces caatingaensis]|uniref:Uncharacterized protein n=1 Tax=Streptomyces caatingaensis TaxID=1678637 RepID=A0A0K9XG08_9ACTN|nr:hypothetical protein [Streptomyces caatingaensis]KNB52349.1 hypothetical protein AC230_12535 [Streptomyces caatingaensis]